MKKARLYTSSPFTMRPSGIRLDKISAVLVVLVVLLAPACAEVDDRAALETGPVVSPDTAPPLHGVIVHLFEWRWADVAQECEAVLGPKGFKAVQVSPVTENARVDDPPRPWWERYQPVSYQVNTRSGDRAAFADMVARCRAVGVDIYVDAILNHMTGVYAGVSIAGTAFGEYDYPGLYTTDDFHHCGLTENDDIWDFDDPDQVWNCELLNLADLKTESPEVQAKLAAYLNDLMDLGVAGFRLDAARHIPTGDIRAILDQVVGQPFIYQEVIDPDPPTWAAAYYQNGLVTEFQYSRQVSDRFYNGPLADLHGDDAMWEERQFLLSNKALVFIDNHDNQRGHGGGGHVVTYKDGVLHELAMVFMLAYPYGVPRVMSSYAFEDDAQGPPADAQRRTRAVHTSGGVDCGQGAWVCEHRSPAVLAMVGFHNTTAADPYVSHWWSDGANQIAFSRGTRGFVAINRSDTPLAQTLTTGLAAGTYCNVIEGGVATDGAACAGTPVTVRADGAVAVRVPPMTALALHEGARLPE